MKLTKRQIFDFCVFDGNRDCLLYIRHKYEVEIVRTLGDVDKLRTQDEVCSDFHASSDISLC